MGSSHYKQNSVEFSIKFQVLGNLLSLVRPIGWVGIPYFKGAKVSDALWVHGWVLGNWDPIKDTWWLPRVDPSSRVVTL